MNCCVQVRAELRGIALGDDRMQLMHRPEQAPPREGTTSYNTFPPLLVTPCNVYLRRRHAVSGGLPAAVQAGAGGAQPHHTHAAHAQPSVQVQSITSYHFLTLGF